MGLKLNDRDRWVLATILLTIGAIIFGWGWTSPFWPPGWGWLGSDWVKTSFFFVTSGIFVILLIFGIYLLYGTTPPSRFPSPPSKIK